MPSPHDPHPSATASSSSAGSASGSTAASSNGSSSSNGSGGGGGPAILNNIRSIFAPTPPSTLLSDLAPQLLTPRILTSSHFSNRSSSAPNNSNGIGASLRERLGIGWPGGSSSNRDANSIHILERVDELLALDVPPAPFDFSPPHSATAAGTLALEFPSPDSQVPLIRGFLATTPQAQRARIERRRKRAGLGELALGLESTKLGLKERGDLARGLLSSGGDADEELGIGRRTSGLGSSKRRKGARSGDGTKGEEKDPVEMSPEELQKEARAVEEDMSNVAVRRALLNNQIGEVELKIAALDAVREQFRRDLLGLREEELELEDELQGLQDRLSHQEETRKGRSIPATSRRRKGPAFLPSEHDELPPNVAFMTLTGHLAPITSLDFSEPYGVAVTASLDESVRLWDLTTGDELGFLRGHSGIVKALQVESSVCVTGGADGQIRIWDLDIAEATFPVPLATPSIDNVTDSFERVILGKSDDSYVGGGSSGSILDDGIMRDEPGRVGQESPDGPCVKTLDGHTRAVTSLYFDGTSLVTGSSDRTLRQWDLQTGQCVLTMDILWAISNPLASQTLSSDDLDGYDAPDPFSTPQPSPRKSLGALRRQSSSFMPSNAGAFPSSPTTTTYADGSWEMYEDFVGGVQFWNYALASGTGDGCVRMWDMRTGQAHRTLVGHTGPVTCVQFDETHVVSGSLDKSIRIWDLRMGSISDTIRYEHPITGLQFDSRKIVAAAGENAVRVYNRTTLQQSSLTINGHTSPVERLRFMDRYLASGGRDCAVKIWALA